MRPLGLAGKHYVPFAEQRLGLEGERVLAPQTGCLPVALWPLGTRYPSRNRCRLF